METTQIIVAAMASVPATIAAAATWARVHRETRTNGGNSLRDSTNRIEARLESFDARLVQQWNWLIQHEERDDRFEQYCHNRFHDILNSLTVVRGYAELDQNTVVETISGMSPEQLAAVIAAARTRKGVAT